MIPDEDITTPANEDGGYDFQDIPTNDKGQMSVPPTDLGDNFEDVRTSDTGFRFLTPEDLFPDIDTNDRGIESE